MSTYTTAEAIRLVGIKKDMLNYLCKVDVVVPTASRKRSKRGHGIERRYSFTDLVSFKVVKQLAASGVSPKKVKKAIKELHDLGITLSRLPSTHVVVFDKSVYQWNGKGDPFRVVDGQKAFGFVLDVASIRKELIADIERAAA